MNSNIPSDLKTAAELIKSGDVNTARSILISVIKSNPENETAWYLLSLSTSDVDRQLFALEQSLNINPEFTIARNRMNKLLGMDRIDAPAPTPQVPDEETNADQEYSADHEQTVEEPGEYSANHELKLEEPSISSPPFTADDLLSQRLLGQSSENDSSNKSPTKERSNPFKFITPIIDRLRQIHFSLYTIMVIVLIILIVFLGVIIIWTKI